MTANFIAKIVELNYQKLDLEKIISEWDGLKKYQSGRLSDAWINREINDDQYIRWVRAWDLLKSYVQDNFSDFEQTDLVYKWAKELCVKKNNMIRNWLGGGEYYTFSDYVRSHYPHLDRKTRLKFR